MKALLLITISILLIGCENNTVEQEIITPEVIAPPVYSNIVYQLAELQLAIDNGGDNTYIELDGDTTYIFDGTLDLRNFSGIHINGNGATIKREDAIKISSEITEDYTGGKELTVLNNNFKIGDRLILASGQHIDDGVVNPRLVTAIDGSKVTIQYPFYRHFKTGDILMKSYLLIGGMPSHVEGGSNSGTIIENINFDGNARNNTVNYGWVVNGTIALHGGKNSEIRNNTFSDIPNECLIGHGVLIHDNEFTGLNGSAFHTSVNDVTVATNGYSEFKNNTVIDMNRIEKGMNAHSEGAISFSWGAGNLVVDGNYFESYSGNYGVFGVFGGATEHPDENLTVTNNTAYNFEYIIKIDLPTKNILITDNLFSNTGVNDFTFLINESTINLNGNILANGTELIL